MNGILGLTVVLAGMLGAGSGEPGMDWLKEVVRAFHGALAAGDEERALSLLDPEVMIFESGGAELSREEYRSHHLGADMEFASAVRREVVEQSTGGGRKVAWVLSRTRTTGTFRQREVRLSGVETMILHRTRGEWRIRHIHWSAKRLDDG